MPPTADATIAAGSGNLSPTAPGQTTADGAGDLTPVTFLAVTGSLTTDGSTPLAFPTMEQGSNVNGKPSYASGSYYCQFNGSNWALVKTGSPAASWIATVGGNTPDLASVWIPQGSATGTPTLALSAPAGAAIAAGAGNLAPTAPGATIP